MSIDVLQERIRKGKNPFVVDLALKLSDLPPGLLENAGGAAAAYGQFCRELLNALKGIIPAVRVSFTAFAVLGPDGLVQLQSVLHSAASLGYYVVLEAPCVSSPIMAEAVAEAVWGDHAVYPCDGLMISVYPGSDTIRPFIPYVKSKKKDLFPVVRTSNKSAPELQYLLTGSRLVHMAAADLVNRFGEELTGKFGYARISVVVGANAADGLRTLRKKYPKLFFLVDDMDYTGCNVKNCSYAFDKFGHGAAVCTGPTVTAAWQKAQTDGSDYLEQAVRAAERMNKTLSRYVTVL